MHHEYPVSWFPEYELDPEKMLTMCRRDHLFVGHLGDWTSYNPEARRDAAIWRRKITSRPVHPDEEKCKQYFGF